MTKDAIAAELEQLGFTANEANVYLALIQRGPMTATAIAAGTGLARTAVYPTINSLVDQGLVDAGEGYGSKFSAVPAERALPQLMLERERLTRDVIERISSLEQTAEAAPEELIQVIRNSRAVGERWQRLQLEAEHLIEVFCKPPFFTQGNPAEHKALRRGVRNRAVYEKGVLGEPGIKPYLSDWLAAGEEARVYDGQLPQKLAIFDRKSVLVPLSVSGGQTQTLLIQHAELANSLGLLFDSFWERSRPLEDEIEQKLRPGKAEQVSSRMHRRDGQSPSRRRRKVADQS